MHVRRAAALGALLALGACSHVRSWWHHAPAPPPAAAAVHELDITGAATPAQYWKRNTLLIDLSSVSGAGQIVLKPAAGNPWPVRLALRVRPGAFGALEVRGAAREVLPIGSAGASPVDLELTPGIYAASTPQITVSWGAAESTEP
jgi:hypothetical protein